MNINTKVIADQQSNFNDSTNKIDSPVHISVLDGLRGFAVLYVMLDHLFPYNIFKEDNHTITKFVYGFMKMGWVGVDLFFVLSGFLITGILVNQKDKKNYFMNFYIRRTLRIFPLYYLMLLVFLVIVPAVVFFKQYDYFFFSTGSLYPYWFYISNFGKELNVAGHNFLCVAWSLSIEEQYYVFYPAIVYLCNIRKLASILLGMLIFSFTLRIVLDVFHLVSVYHFTLTHLDGMAIGGLISIANFDSRHKEKINLFFKYSFKCIAIALIIITIYCQFTMKSEYNHICYHPLMKRLGYIITPLFFGGVLLKCLQGKGIYYKIFNMKLLRNVGKYSYCMYLIHFPVSSFINIFINKIFDCPFSVITP